MSMDVIVLLAYVWMLIFDAGVLVGTVWLIEKKKWDPGTVIIALIIIASSSPRGLLELLMTK